MAFDAQQRQEIQDGIGKRMEKNFVKRNYETGCTVCVCVCVGKITITNIGVHV